MPSFPPSSSTSPAPTPVPSYIQALYGGLPCENFSNGGAISYKNKNLQMIANVSSTRYVGPEVELAARPLVASITDGATYLGTPTWFADLLIPGGMTYNDDRTQVSFSFSSPVNIGTGQLIIGLFGDGTDSTPTPSAPTWYANVNLAGTFYEYSLNFDAIQANGLFLSNAANPNNPTAMAPYAGNSNKHLNLQADWHIKIGFCYTTTTSGRVFVPYNCLATVRNAVPIADSTVTYRNLIADPYAITPANPKFTVAYGTHTYLRPFADTSIWNTPIGAGITYTTSGDQRTVLLRNANPGGVNGGAATWMQGFQTGTAAVVYQAKIADPICNFTFTSRSLGAVWPFPFTSPTSAGSFTARCQASALLPFQTTDVIALVITPDGRYMIEGGQYSYNSGTNTHAFGHMSIIDLYGSGASWLAGYNNIDSNFIEMSEGYRASGGAVMAGIVYGSELTAGLIPHGIAMQLSPQQQLAGVVAVVSAGVVTAETFVLAPTQTIAVITGYISGTTLTVSSVVSGAVGDQGLFGGGAAAGTKITAGSGTSWTVTPSQTLGSSGSPVTMTVGVIQDYTTLFPTGTNVWYNGVAYTTTGTPAYSTATNQTTIVVTAAISGSASDLYLGGATTALQQASQFVWPATNCDSLSLTTNNNDSYQGLIPMGAQIIIPPGVNLTTIGLATAEGLTLATALQKYGGINVDTAPFTFSLAQLYCDVTSSQVANLETDMYAIRAQLVLSTNNTIATPGGGGTPSVTPQPLLRI